MVESSMCRSLWYADGFDWAMKESERAFGGLLCVWNKLDFMKKGEFKGDGFLGITGEWGPSKVKCSLVNVYAPNDRQKKVQLWNELKMSILEEEEMVDHG
ncbi:hypothetical protein SLE2022_314670 [Rubroshorea leprosula]